jgi:hypothetical protein
MNWKEVKQSGSRHYKIGSIEPIDLIKAGGMLWDFALSSIIKYAYRTQQNITADGPTTHDVAPIVTENLDKIIHYAQMLKVCVEEGAENDRHQNLTQCDKKATK